jgi:acyl-coenzyme A synthetase/AMP-(fatty) acid ligase
LDSRIFFADPKAGTTKTYSGLVEDLNKMTHFPKYVYNQSVYELYLSLIHSLTYGYKITVVDRDVSSAELANYGIDEESLNEEYTLPERKTLRLSALLENKNSWSVDLFTSGTTGMPKKITQSYDILTRNVKVGPNYLQDVWGSGYNPTHMAGLQVLFQAFNNGNSLINLFELDGRKLLKAINKYRVNSISATPSLFRVIAHESEWVSTSINRLTMGGEPFDSELSKRLAEIFPQAKIRNIYASTEAGSLLTSKNGFFSIPLEKATFIKIDSNNQLLLHRSLLAKSKDLDLVGDWYLTGDVVEFTESNVFKIVGRENEGINVGGYVVNPNEVEQEINKIDFVTESLVYAKESKLIGNILVVDIVLNEPDLLTISEAEYQISQLLSKSLQRWKVPRIFHFCENIKLTRSGKKVRL